MAGECGTPNPLVHLTSHITQDQSLKQEGHSSVFIQGDPLHGQVRLQDGSADQNFVQEYISENHSSSYATPNSFNMGVLLEEMKEIESAKHTDSTFATAHIWSEEYNTQNSSLAARDQIWVKDFQNTSSVLSSTHNEDLDLLWASDYFSSFQQGPSDTKDLNDPKWNNDPDLSRIANEIVESTDDPKLADTKFYKFLKKIGNSEEAYSSTSKRSGSLEEKWTTDYISEFSTHTMANEKNSEVSTWVDEFTSQRNAEKEPDYWDKLQNEWDTMAKEQNGEDHPWLSDFESVASFSKEYKFEDDNPLKNHSSPFDEGLKKLQEGDIPTAVLYFEAAVQKEHEHAKAWLYLGTSLAENEQDPEAIIALRRCLELEPGNLNAVMALAVSYTNESYQEQACYMLKDWLKFHPKYKHLVNTDSAPHSKFGIMSIMSRELYNELMDLYLNAANETCSEVDPDVQCGLGVLLNLSGEYDKAADCFRVALQVKPDDALLWNRLGATLANGNKSEEAVQAYHHTLALSPGFIRSRYNLGISCVNLGAHREAVEHFLTALNSQTSSKVLHGTMNKPSLASENIWSTLRMVLSLMNRTDLYSAVDNRDLVVLNQEFNIAR